MPRYKRFPEVCPQSRVGEEEWLTELFFIQRDWMVFQFAHWLVSCEKSDCTPKREKSRRWNEVTPPLLVGKWHAQWRWIFGSFFFEAHTDASWFFFAYTGLIHHTVLLEFVLWGMNDDWFDHHPLSWPMFWIFLRLNGSIRLGVWCVSIYLDSMLIDNAPIKYKNFTLSYFPLPVSLTFQDRL